MHFFASTGRFLPLLRQGILCLIPLLISLPSRSQDLPINVQGRVTVDGVAFDGTGRFKFALVHSTGRLQLWSHDGTSNGADFQPTGFVELNVIRGLYSVLLGDTTIIGMTQAIDPSIFANDDVRLRVWFNDGAHGFQRLSPDQRLAAVGYSKRSQRADQAAVLTGNVTIEQVPSLLVTNNESGVTLTGQFIGDGSLLSGIRGSTPFQIATNGTNIAFPNTGYLTTSITETVILLPPTETMRVGDLVRVGAGDPGPWRIAQHDGQSVHAGHFQGSIGAKWTGRDSVRPWQGVATSQDGANLVAICKGVPFGSPSILLSTNSGVDWFESAITPKNWNVVASSADGSRLIVGTADEYVYLSSDSGFTWNRRTVPGLRLWNGVASSGNGSNLLAVASSAAFVSQDAGESWTPRSPLGIGWSGAAVSLDGQTFLVGGSALSASVNGGASWSGGNAPAASWTAVAISADGQRLLASASGSAAVTGLYVSTDSGVTWVRRDPARAYNALACSADGTKIAALSGNALYISVDGGHLFTARDETRAWTGIAISADAKRITATVQNGRIFTSQSLRISSTTPGVAGYLVGGEASAVELQHVGNGRFVPRSSSGEIFAY